MLFIGPPFLDKEKKKTLQANGMCVFFQESYIDSNVLILTV